MSEKQILEKDLYQPVKRFLEQNGFTVRAEVDSCDVVALRENMLAAVELKRSLNLEVILQAAERQKMADMVYIAIPAASHPNRARYRRILGLLRRLEIGLLEVSQNKSHTRVHETLPPVCLDLAAAKVRSRRRRQRMEKEFAGRSADYNTGGVTRTKIISAYREQAVAVALYLKEQGEDSAAHIKRQLDCARAYDIVYHNYYGWFVHIAKGRYALSEKGCSEAPEFARRMEQMKEAAEKEG